MPSEISTALIGPLVSLPPIPDSVAIDNFFQQRAGMHCLQWFNARLANAGPWKDVVLVDTPQNRLLFHQFWNQSDSIFGGDMTAIQFLCLMSIFANECRCDFQPATEKMGRKGHPGMAYLFDRIEFKDANGKVVGSKRSYNTLAGNKTAFECFNDGDYIAAHGELPLAAALARTTDQRWSGEEWPAEAPTSPNPDISGFITQADFIKFRGRGFIQTTGRTNYLELIRFVKAFEGENSTVDFFQHQWSDLTPQQVAFTTTNEDWDRLFQQSDMIIAAEAIRRHNAGSGNYLNLSSDAAVLNGTGPGSVFNMGKRISGGTQYAALYKERVVAVLAALQQIAP